MDPGQLLEAIEEDKLQFFIDNNINSEILDNLNFNPLIQTVIYHSFNVGAYILMNTDKYTNSFDENGNNALMYCLRDGKYYFAMMLLDNGFTDFSHRNNQGKLALDFIKKTEDIPPELLSRILSKKTNNCYSSNTFRIYNIDEMNLKALGKSGSYGSVYYDTINDNVVKISTSESTNESLIHEMMILRMINIANPDLVVTIKGICFNSGKFSLVLESLSYSLQDIFKVYRDVNISLKASFFKDIFFRLLDNIDKLHCMGILHRDLKPNNIMLTPSGHLKIIDFGICEYVGVLPSKVRFVGTPSYVAPDSNSLNSFKLPNGETILMPGLERNYTSDIYSIASIMVNSIMGLNVTLFFYDGDIFYYYEKPVKGVIKLHSLHKDVIDLFDEFSPFFLDLLSKMLELDSTLRISAREALNHMFFAEYRSQMSPLSVQKYYSNPKENMFDEELNEKIFAPITRIKNYFFSDDEIRLSRGPLKYGEDIYEFNKESKLPPTNVPDHYLEQLKADCLNFDSSKADYYELQTFDLFFNSNIYLSSVSPVNNIRFFELFFGVSITKNERSQADLFDSLKSIVESNIDLYPVSISSMIEYYILTLQKMNIPSSIIMEMRNLAYNQFYELSYTKRDREISIGDFMNSIIIDVSNKKKIKLPII